MNNKAPIYYNDYDETIKSIASKYYDDIIKFILTQYSDEDIIGIKFLINDNNKYELLSENGNIIFNSISELIKFLNRLNRPYIIINHNDKNICNVQFLYGYKKK